MRVYNSQKALKLLSGGSAKTTPNVPAIVTPSENPATSVLVQLIDNVRAAEEAVREVGFSHEATQALGASSSDTTEIKSLLQHLEALLASAGVNPRVQETAINGSFRLYGPIQKLSPVEVIEFTRNSRKTGCVTVEDGDFIGLVSILDGEVIYAEAGDRLGFEAFCEIIQATNGKVEFLSVPISPEERNIHYATLELLFRALQSLDERSCEMRR